MIEKHSDNLFYFAHGAIDFTVTILSNYVIICGSVGQQIFNVPENTVLEDFPRLFNTMQSIRDRATLYTETLIDRNRFLGEVDRLYHAKQISDNIRHSLLDTFYSCKCSSNVLKQRLSKAGLDPWFHKMDCETLQSTLKAHIGCMQLLLKEIT